MSEHIGSIGSVDPVRLAADAVLMIGTARRTGVPGAEGQAVQAVYADAMQEVTASGGKATGVACSHAVANAESGHERELLIRLGEIIASHSATEMVDGMWPWVTAALELAAAAVERLAEVTARTPDQVVAELMHGAR